MSQQQQIQFDVNIYPSAARRGQHAVAITSAGGESLVIGFTSDPEKTQEELGRLLKSEAGWSHNEQLNYRTLQVKTSCARSS